jgi:hypothetical protein
MRRSSGKKRAQRTKMAKAMRKPMRKKTTKKGKKPPNPWIQHVNAVFKEMRKTDPGVSLKDAIKEAKKTYKKGQKADSWNVSSSKYSTVSKKKNNDSWNVSTSKYSTVGKKGKKKKGKSRRRRRSRRRVGGNGAESCSGIVIN